ncbi:MAG: hypothetical protein H6Q86_1861 [candidate division NC10 bacterium]|nr:hypothetical protein [candidate division NC10 bacterium]
MVASTALAFCHTLDPDSALLWADGSSAAAFRSAFGFRFVWCRKAGNAWRS